jgi:phosphoesterase RecJ-like protein
MLDILNKIIRFIKSFDNFLITTHMNADGDALASMLAVAYLLEAWKKRYEMVIHDSLVDNKYNFLWGAESIVSGNTDINQTFDAAILLDVPSRKRIGSPAVYLPSSDKCVKIDHHPPEEDFARYQLVNVEASSTSQLIYELVMAAEFSMDRNMAEIIFTGIMYDTGRFSFSNTSQRDFQIAADLLLYGVKPHEIANRLFFTNSFTSMKTLGYALSHMELILDGRISLIHLPHSIMVSNNQGEIEELANYSVAIKGVEVGLFIREVEPNYFKVSFRSKGRINVNTIAKTFGGGGHTHAAGARFSGKYADLRKRIEEEFRKYLKSQ